MQKTGFRLPAWFWHALLIGWWVVGLGQAPLFDVDEGAFSEASREMLASGDWGHTTLNGSDRFDKPIFIYWLQAASMAVFGVTEWAVRLPSALAALVWCLAVGHFAHQRLGGASKWLGAVMVATSLGVMLIGRASTADAMLNTLITLAALDLWRALETGERAPQRRAFLWVGLGLLTKGPVAVLVPGAAGLLFMASNRSFRPLLRLLNDWVSWALVLGTAVPWYAYALNRHGMAFIEGFILKHNVSRYLAPMEGHGGSALYFFVALPVIMLPWAPALVAAVARWRITWATPWMRFMALWAGFVVVFFSMSGTKLPHYGMYGLTPLILLSVAAIEADRSGWLPRALAIVQGAMLALLSASLLLAPKLAETTRDVLARSLLQQPLEATTGVVLGVLAMVALAVVWARPWSLSLRAGVSAALLAVWTLNVFVPAWAQRMQGPVKALALIAKAETLRQATTVTQWSLHQPSLAFYLQQPAPRREPQPGEMALVRVDRTDVTRADLEVLGQSAGFALVRKRPTVGGQP